MSTVLIIVKYFPVILCSAIPMIMVLLFYQLCHFAKQNEMTRHLARIYDFQSDVASFDSIFSLIIFMMKVKLIL